MRRKAVALVAILTLAVVSTGCLGLSGREITRNIKGKVWNTVGGLRNVNHFVDRHLFNYTWDDPYAFENVYVGR